jgi:hypothetical protein
MSDDKGEEPEGQDEKPDIEDDKSLSQGRALAARGP